jgi:hypothetical protein
MNLGIELPAGICEIFLGSKNAILLEIGTEKRIGRVCGNSYPNSDRHPFTKLEKWVPVTFFLELESCNQLAGSLAAGVDIVRCIPETG